MSKRKKTKVVTPDVVEGNRDISLAVSNGGAFNEGEQGEFEGAVYASRIDNNVWTPRQHPAVWTLISFK